MQFMNDIINTEMALSRKRFLILALADLQNHAMLSFMSVSTRKTKTLCATSSISGIFVLLMECSINYINSNSCFCLISLNISLSRIDFLTPCSPVTCSSPPFKMIQHPYRFSGHQPQNPLPFFLSYIRESYWPYFGVYAVFDHFTLILCHALFLAKVS